MIEVRCIDVCFMVVELFLWMHTKHFVLRLFVTALLCILYSLYIYVMKFFFSTFGIENMIDLP